MKKTITLFLFTVLLFGSLTVTASATGTRKWKASYNANLNGMTVAAPHAYRVGQKIHVTYHGTTIVVHAVAGGCSCFDLSDEAFVKLAPLSKGVITVTADRP